MAVVLAYEGRENSRFLLQLEKVLCPFCFAFKVGFANKNWLITLFDYAGLDLLLSSDSLPHPLLIINYIHMGGTFQATAGFQDLDVFQKVLNLKMALRCILSVNSHLSGFRLKRGPTHAYTCDLCLRYDFQIFRQSVFRETS